MEDHRLNKKVFKWAERDKNDRVKNWNYRCVKKADELSIVLEELNLKNKL